ncbi:MAG TPA: 50S ribosomal protein L29 [Candidatus Pacearchaeota archaeon]|nr:50S ribosomal protein L29 [Candidatus Paceibacterota bacterium]HOK00522.1 50S ribosomal protein L29 [Candidatus Pacearchaeota archaeon]HOL90351.1 50S ribosomal protein L29 [Candidatus Pacearchaeota archaeon]HPO68547.1 50S ribosomal protein L29 [Candidatus Pacearchaeota archaeon]
MKAKELKNKTPDELKQLLKEKREKLYQFKVDLSAGKVKDIREIRLIKKDIARILTILKEKNIKI